MSVKLFRPGSGRHRQQKAGPLVRGASTAGAVVAAAASVLCAGGVATAGPAVTPVEAQDDEEDESRPEPTGNRSVGLIVIDNSFADSWLEVDRTLNTLLLGKGTAGSDHDGGGGAIDVKTGDGSGAGSGAAPAPAPAPAPTPAAAPAPAPAQEPDRPHTSSGNWTTEVGHPPWQGESGE
ncbi:hypothetical protein ACFV0C_04210 [Streptomyces sp. NPDC059568]|uniref:hypothetical protein n=1 Tax=Streptomyces sp. NPDC059568 TaxID=3346868 RepID=UPI00369763F7